jgi:tetratricopeptide (TPR) repeat protein
MNTKKQLEVYNEALNKLPLEGQVDKVNAIKSKKNLERFSGADAPIRLVQRFAFKINETLDVDFNEYEKGRLLYLRGELDAAESYLTYAADNGDQRALIYLGYIALKRGMHIDAIEMFYTAGEHLDLDNFSLLFLLQAAINHKNLPLLNVYTHLVKKCSPHYLPAVRALFDDDEETAFNLLERGVAENDEASVLLLLELENGPKSFELLEKLVTKGNYNLMHALVTTYEQHGMVEEAKRGYQLALKLGQQEAFLPYIKFLVNNGKAAEAVIECEARITADAEYFFGMLLIFATSGEENTELLENFFIRFISEYDPDVLLTLFLKIIAIHKMQGAQVIMEIMKIVDANAPNAIFYDAFRYWLTGDIVNAKNRIAAICSMGQSVPEVFMKLVFDDEQDAAFN